MFIRKLTNRSGSISVQIISKADGKYQVVKTIGSSREEQEIARLVFLGQQEVTRLKGQRGLFVFEKDALVESCLSSLSNADIRTVGPELVFGKIYDAIGFNVIGEELFRHLVIARLAFPLSKLKTIDYLYRFQGLSVNITTVYRFLDKLSNRIKQQVEQIAFRHTLKTLGGQISIDFYDMTTLYFEASDEDDLRKTGFSKDGKHQQPQIYIGLLVGLGGYAIGYDIFEGNIYEGDTLIPFIEAISKKFNLGKPVVVADAGLLSYKNIEALEDQSCQYIIGARLKNADGTLQQQIMKHNWEDGQTQSFFTKSNKRLIVSYSNARAAKDEHNRTRGLQQLEKQLRSGRLTKAHINNKGYNKYLKMEGELNLTIDYEKFEKDRQWDGLKGYITNTTLSEKAIVENYKNLWHIERAFRMSKTDLRIRPIYHRLQHRTEAHICLSFTAYCIYKELERILQKEKSAITLQTASEITHTIYQLKAVLPEYNQTKTYQLRMDDKQAELCRIIDKNF